MAARRLYAALWQKEGRLLQAWLMPDMEQNAFQASLNDSSSEGKADILLILDGARSHRSKVKLVEKLNLKISSAYSPELNPVETRFQELRKALSIQIFNPLEGT